MASYGIYRRSPEDAPGADEIILRDGFAWWPAVLGPFWALWHGLWVVALGLIAVLAVAAVLPWPVMTLATVLAQGALVGWHAADLRGWGLERDGYHLDAIVVAATFEEAERRALAREAP